MNGFFWSAHIYKYYTYSSIQLFMQNIDDGYASSIRRTENKQKDIISGSKRSMLTR